MRIVIAAGGTAGHVVPALAVADALRAAGCEVVFVGGQRAEGRPVPPPFVDRAAARARFEVGEHERCVAVFGGSLGARSINEAAVAGLGEAPFRVIHVAGERDYPSLHERGVGPRYLLLKYLPI